MSIQSQLSALKEAAQRGEKGAFQQIVKEVNVRFLSKDSSLVAPHHTRDSAGREMYIQSVR